MKSTLVLVVTFAMISPATFAASARANPNPYQLGPVSTIPAALQRLADIQTYIAANGPGNPDGVGVFNEVYTVITNDVYQALNDGQFSDPTFMTTLDVAFANRYFDALRDGVAAGPHVPLPWADLIDTRANPDIEKLQFAIAGINAHIDYDLAAATLTVFEQQGFAPTAPEFATFQQSDEIFAEETQELRQRFETEFEAQLDQPPVTAMLNEINDLLVDLTRDKAWADASAMWNLLPLGQSAIDAYMANLELTSGAAGLVTLIPIHS